MALTAGASPPSALLRRTSCPCSLLSRRLSSSLRTRVVTVLCESPTPAGDDNSSLRIGSPIVVVDAPPVLKTANSISCLKVNAGLVKPGDVGRIVARKPKDVWAVRLAIGTYLIDGKHFKPLEIVE